MANRRSTSATRLLVLTASPVARRSRASTISPRLRANLVLRRLTWAAAGDLADASLIEPGADSAAADSSTESFFNGRAADARPAA